MAIEVVVQDGRANLKAEGADDEVPPSSDFNHWINHASNTSLDSVQVTVRIVDPEESQQLNFDYRGKNSPTNVLSFPYGDNEFSEQLESIPVFGDLVICADIVRREANEKGVSEGDHWAHLTIHGMLHLMGYDHIENDQAHEMETLEINLLKQLNIKNPYEVVTE